VKNLIRIGVLVMLISLLFGGCKQADDSAASPGDNGEFEFQADQFADIRILRYQVPGFDELTGKQQELVYYLYEAGLSGRDIIWDQNYRYNLRIRKALENIYNTTTADRSGPEWEEFQTYIKRIWFSNGIHHHYSKVKILPGFSEEYFRTLAEKSEAGGFGLRKEETAGLYIDFLVPLMFDPEVDGKKVVLDSDVDQIASSATNYYGQGLTQSEVESFYSKKIDRSDPHPVSYGLNSKLVKEDGRISERVWKVGGMYSGAIEKIVFWLNKAAAVAENENQKAALEKLVEYYETGDLKIFDEYNVLWVQDTDSVIDLTNGFIEVYEDPLGYRGSYESLVSYRDFEASKRMTAISDNAQWFEDSAPFSDSFKKSEVTGVSGKVINVAGEAGDASPSTPIGINLPNANWIRKEHGSKSVNLGNIVGAYTEASKTGGVLEEFAYSDEEIARSKEFGAVGDNLHTDLHEVVGHGSGQLAPGVATPKETLKGYANTLEESRADLFALYYMMDPKLVEIGLMPSIETGKASYDDYIRNSLLVQMARIDPGENLEEAHMRNRQLIAKWAFEKGSQDEVINQVRKDGKTFFVINNYEKLRILFGELLSEVQRIKSEGDYQAGKALVEGYGVELDPQLHMEVRERYAKLNRAPYSGFINPLIKADIDSEGNATGVNVTYPADFAEQMLYYSKNYSFLPLDN
jgi:dipeptidyl-peptidase III